MIKRGLFFFLLFPLLNCFAQTPVLNWGLSIGGSTDEEMHDIVIIDTSLYQCSICPLRLVGTTASDDGNLSSCGSTAGDYDAMVIKINTDGTGYTCEAYGGSGYDEFNTGIFHKPSANVYQNIYLGQTSSNDGDVIGNHGMSDAWLVRIQFNNIVSQKCIGGANRDAGFDFIEMPDKGFIICGVSASDIIAGDTMNYHGYDDGWVTRVDSLGNIIWSKLYGGALTDYLLSIDRTTDGNYVCVGYSNSIDSTFSNNHGAYDFWVIKIDSQGNLLWQKIFGGSGTEEAFTVLASENNTAVVIGYNNSINGDVSNHHGQSAFSDIWIITLDSLGNLIWERSYGGAAEEHGYSFCKTQDGNFVVVGSGNSVDGDLSGVQGFQSTWIFKIDPLGTILWSGRFGSNNAEGKQFSVKTYDSRTFYFISHPLISGGNVTTFYGGFDDIWIASVTDTSQYLSTPKYLKALNFNYYPNPVEDKLYLNYQGNTDYNIQLYNYQGGLIHSEKINYGEYILDMKEKKSGIYFLKLTFNNNVYTVKVIKTE